MSPPCDVTRAVRVVIDPENGFCGGRYDTGRTSRKSIPVLLCKVIGTSWSSERWLP